MKKYLKFISEDLEEIKDNIADKIKSEETNDNDNEKMELDEKPNEKIIEDIIKNIEKFEKEKNTIKKKIETFNDEINIAEDPEIVKDLEDKVKKLEIDLKTFDDMLSDTLKQKQTLEKLKD
jgi:chromosome segregation ATPase